MFLYKADAKYYKEWHIKPRQQGVDRGSQRLVTGKNGEVYLTNTHYGQNPGVQFHKVLPK